jgi:hypothetical protein
MNKNYIYIGVGVLAIGGLAWYFMRGKSMDSQKSAMGFGNSSSSTASQDASTTSSASESTSSTTPSEPVFTSAGDTRKAVRKECRSYAKQTCGRGLGGGKKRCRKEKRKQCKAEGGYESSSESEDFAFNGLVF